LAVLESFTEDARLVVVRAQEEARTLGHDFVGVEHLLLGVARTDPALLRVTAEEIRAQVAERLPVPAQRVAGSSPFTAGAKGALERSLTGALGQGARQIAPEHVMAALLVDERVATVLRDCGEPPADAAPE
jgi:ATP-dependent Clp protease ATP-binding subunit ClpC